MAEDVVQYDPETDGGFEHFGLDYYLPLAFTAKYARAELPCQVEIRAVLEDGKGSRSPLRTSRTFASPRSSPRPARQPPPCSTESDGKRRRGS